MTLPSSSHSGDAFNLSIYRCYSLQQITRDQIICEDDDDGDDGGDDDGDDDDSDGDVHLPMVMVMAIELYVWFSFQYMGYRLKEITRGHNIFLPRNFTLS